MEKSENRGAPRPPPFVLASPVFSAVPNNPPVAPCRLFLPFIIKQTFSRLDPRFRARPAGHSVSCHDESRGFFFNHQARFALRTVFFPAANEIFLFFVVVFFSPFLFGWENKKRKGTRNLKISSLSLFILQEVWLVLKNLEICVFSYSLRRDFGNFHIRRNSSQRIRLIFPAPIFSIFFARIIQIFPLPLFFQHIHEMCSLWTFFNTIGRFMYCI